MRIDRRTRPGPFEALFPVIAGACLLSLALGAVAMGRGQDAGAPSTEAATATSAARDWRIFRGDPGLAGRAAGVLPAKPVLLWSYEAAGAITSSPVVADGRVYCGSDDTKLHCVDAETGAGLWTLATEDMIEAPPLVVDDAVFVGSGDGWLYCADAATGALRWKAETGDRILGGANFVRTPERTVVVVGSYDANLYGFDAASGEQLWAYATDNYVNGTPAIHDGRAVFGGCDSVLHAVRASDGEAAGALALGEECHVAGSVAVAGDRAYFGHYGNQFICVDLRKNEIVWTYDSRQPFFSSPAIGDDRLVFGGRDKLLHCVRRADGEPVWTFPTRRKVDGSPVLVGDRVVFGSGDGRLYVVALEDGAELWSYDLGKAIVASPAVVNGKLYIGANDGRLYAFGEAPR